MPRTVTSRLIKNERNKMLRQIFVFSGLAVILTAIFIFVILPLFIRFINAVLSTNPIAEDETVLLQPPVLAAPVEATNSAQLKINGFDSVGHEVVIVLNGGEAGKVSAKEDGSFEAKVNLTEGENSITSYAIDEKDNESKTGQSYLVILDTEKPSLTVAEPLDSVTIASKDKLVTVAGTTEPTARIFVNDRIIFPNAEGDFSTRVNLNDGTNEVTVKATDDAGNTTEIKLTVNYSR